MRTTALFTIAIGLLTAPLAAQEPKPVPKDSARVSITGCTKGYVFTVGPDNTAAFKPVVVSRQIGNESVIAKGLQAGEQVVTDSTDRLRDGSPIEIRTPGAAGGDAGPRGQGRGREQGQGRGTHRPPTQ